jgi:hypothetical protein
MGIHRSVSFVSARRENRHTVRVGGIHGNRRPGWRKLAELVVRLQPDMTAGVIDVNLIGVGVVGHRDNERAAMAACVDPSCTCRDREAGSDRAQHCESGHDVLLERQKYPG